MLCSSDDLGWRSLEGMPPGDRQNPQIHGGDRFPLLVRDESIAAKPFLGTGAGGGERQDQKGAA